MFVRDNVFRFAFEHVLMLLGTVPLLVLFFLWAFRQKAKAMARFGNPELMAKLTLTVSRKRQIWKRVLLTAAVLLLILATARPQFGTRMRTVQREGQDIMVALDVSLSMTAEDIKPNRLEKARHQISTLIDKLQGDRIGLTVFAGRAFVQCPLTLDYGAAKMFLNAVDTDLIPVPGTAIAEAIERAAAAFSQEERQHKVLLLITDGEDHEGKPLEAAKEAARQGVVIYTVGLGSRQGVPIPVFDARGRRDGFKKDENGQVVMTSLDALTLEKIALETGGKYYRASPGEAELDKIYDHILGMEKKDLASRNFAQFEDRFQFLLAAAVMLLIIELFLPEKRRLRREWRGRFNYAKK